MVVAYFDSLGFERSYDCEIRRRLPPNGYPHYAIPPADAATEGLLVSWRVGGREFIANFEPHDFPLNAVFATPRADTALVVAGGCGYFFRPEAADADACPILPVNQIAARAESNVLVAASFTDLIGMVDGDQSWVARDLVTDELTILSLESDAIRVKGWSGPRNRQVDLILDPTSGVVVATEVP
ncbi:MAG TPA: hypothetical protein VK988_05905 [Acidimicrobiales bacterium]|nr:hypothetical protein [Acidimicrobiales bacterium]